MVIQAIQDGFSYAFCSCRRVAPEAAPAVTPKRIDITKFHSLFSGSTNLNHMKHTIDAANYIHCYATAEKEKASPKKATFFAEVDRVLEVNDQTRELKAQIVAFASSDPFACIHSEEITRAEISTFLEKLSMALTEILLNEHTYKKYPRPEIDMESITSELYPTVQEYFVDFGVEQTLLFIQTVDTACEEKDTTAVYNEWTPFYGDRNFFASTASLDQTTTSLPEETTLAYNRACKLFFILDDLLSDSTIKATPKNIDLALDAIGDALGIGFSKEGIDTTSPLEEKIDLIKEAVIEKLFIWADHNDISRAELESMGIIVGRNPHTSLHAFFKVLDYVKIHKEGTELRAPVQHANLADFSGFRSKPDLDTSRCSRPIQTTLDEAYLHLSRLEFMFDLLSGKETDDELLTFPVSYEHVAWELENIERSLPGFTTSFLTKLEEETGFEEARHPPLASRLADAALSEALQKSFACAIEQAFSDGPLFVTEEGWQSVDRQWTREATRTPHLRLELERNDDWAKHNRLIFGVHRLLSFLISKNGFERFESTLLPSSAARIDTPLGTALTHMEIIESHLLPFVEKKASMLAILRDKVPSEIEALVTFVQADETGMFNRVFGAVYQANDENNEGDYDFGRTALSRFIDHALVQQAFEEIGAPASPPSHVVDPENTSSSDSIFSYGIQRRLDALDDMESLSDSSDEEGSEDGITRVENPLELSRLATLSRGEEPPPIPIHVERAVSAFIEREGAAVREEGLLIGIPPADLPSPRTDNDGESTPSTEVLGNPRAPLPIIEEENLDEQLALLNNKDASAKDRLLAGHNLLELGEYGEEVIETLQTLCTDDQLGKIHGAVYLAGGENDLGEGFEFGSNHLEEYIYYSAVIATIKEIAEEL